MNNSSSTPVSLSHYIYLKEYISYLLKHRLQEAGKEYIKLLDELKVSSLDHLQHMNETQLQAFFQAELAEVFTNIIEGENITNAIISISRWKSKAAVSPGEKINLNEIITILSIRKRVLLHCLQQYTSDCSLMIQVMQEVEQLYLETEKFAYSTCLGLELNILSHKTQLLASIVNNTTNGLCAFDQDLKILEWNTAFAKHFGLEGKLAVGQNLTEVSPVLLTLKDSNQLGRVFKGESVCLDERSNEADTHWLEVSIKPLVNADKAIIGGLYVTNNAIRYKQTEQKLQEHQEELEAANEELHENLTQLEEAQEALKEREAMLLEAQAIAHLGNWDYNIGSNTLYFSDEMKRIFGLDLDTSIFFYEDFIRLLHPEDKDTVDQAIQESIQQKIKYSIEYRIVRHDGTIKWILAHGQPYYSHQVPYKMKGTVLDITARKEAELKVAAEQHFIKSITDTSPDVITVYDLLEKKNIYANKELFAILGYTEADLAELRALGPAGLQKIIHPDDLPKLFAFLMSYRSYAGNLPREIEYRGKDKKGNYKWVMSRYNVFKKDPEGWPTQIIGVTRDISGRKEAEEQVRKNETRLLEAQAKAHLGDWELDLSSNQVYWSKELYNIYGLSADTSLDFNKLKEYIFDKDYAEWQNTMEEAIQFGRSFTSEYRIKRPDNTIRYILTKGEPIFDDSRHLVCFKGITQDVTERVQAEIALRESRIFIEAITDAVPNVIFVYDIQENIYLYTNKQISQMLGYLPEQIQQTGTRILESNTHPDDLALLKARDQKYLTAAKDEIIEVVFRVRRADGEWRWLRSQSKIFKYDQQGKPKQVLGSTEDITERKLAEEKIRNAYYQLREANEELVRTEELLTETNNELEERVGRRTSELLQKNKELVRINTELDNFIYTASHDLKAPITNLEGLLMALNRTMAQSLPEREASIMKMMDESVIRLKNTIKDLTEVSKLQKDIEQEQSEKVNVWDLLQEVQMDISSLIAVTHPIIEVDLGVENIYFSKRNLRSIIYNLLTNAIKYRAPERQPHISIHTYAADNGTVLAVTDNGVGIPANQQSKIFSLFRRLHTDVEGSGIGLYLVKKIVDNNGGNISVQSELGKGTTFSVFLNSKVNHEEILAGTGN